MLMPTTAPVKAAKLHSISTLGRWGIGSRSVAFEVPERHTFSDQRRIPLARLFADNRGYVNSSRWYLRTGCELACRFDLPSMKASSQRWYLWSGDVVCAVSGRPTRTSGTNKGYSPAACRA